MFGVETLRALRQVYPSPTTVAPVAGRPASLIQDRIEAFALGCMPMIARTGYGPFTDQLLQNKWIWRMATLWTLSFDYGYYQSACDQDIDKTIALMNHIAAVPDEHISSQVKCFYLHNLLSHIIAYRPGKYFDKDRSKVVSLPIRFEGQVQVRPCRFERAVDLCGGVILKIFVPADGKGSATYLFTGTTPWLCADGAAIGILDDFNPMGPGEGLRFAARSRLERLMREHRANLGESPLLVGHSLGGIVATALAADLPGLVSQVVAFNAARPSLDVADRWEQLQARACSDKLPEVDTFISRFSGRCDLVSLVGSRWIGRVYCVDNDRDVDFIQRHTMPIGIGQSGDTRIEQIDVAIMNQKFIRRTPWLSMLHTMVVLPIAITLFMVTAIKRFFVGWNRGGLWRWGVFGAIYLLTTSRPLPHG